MNIFAVSPDPDKCARALDDKRLRKMVVETAQLLSTALHEWNHPVAKDVYKPTHRNHPCAIWVRESWHNFTCVHWLLGHYLDEYDWRFNKKHRTNVVWKTILDHVPKACLPLVQSLYNPPNCTPYKDGSNVHEAYKQTLRDKWLEDEAKGRPPTWTNRDQPEWR
jgi:hypothetical protein